MMHDFETDYPQNYANLMSVWPRLRVRLVDILITSKKINDEEFTSLKKNLTGTVNDCKYIHGTNIFLL